MASCTGVAEDAGVGAVVEPLGAATSIHLASAPDLEQVTGRYFANSKPKRSCERSYDKVVAARLWQVRPIWSAWPRLPEQGQTSTRTPITIVVVTLRRTPRSRRER
jgi:hypothetical protein